ncbi:uridine 5'-monophosphate synthase isoform X2 [Odontomachus brunneus]|uniref:uridine 5'-monophosphate synthase isoform X2 n=1 Tax=Odontomachus brunneus TaxID=486640 RepID=UPI0013F1B3B9|nr:uridine 5'-monophosphate synthase isoform X2 [Odontomachus brunneus]
MVDRMEEIRKELAVMLYDIKAVKFGEFTTKIGIKTPIYFDLRVIIAYPTIIGVLAQALWKLRRHSTNKVNQICGVPYTALPLATLISVQNDIRMLIKRKEAKSYGTMKLVEGVYLPRDNCVIIEDVITSGSSILETVNVLRKEQLTVTEALVIIDREQGGRYNLENHDIEVKSIFTVTAFMKYLFEAGKITKQIMHDVNNYMRSNQVQIPPLSLPMNRLKLSYYKRAELAQNPLASRLLKLMEKKQSNLCLAADFTEAKAILHIADLAGPHIVVLKLHIDIVEDFDKEFMRDLKQLAKQHEFLLMEDRKFSDIGKTVALQYNKGIYKISEWADLVTVHAVSGKTVLDALKKSLPPDVTEHRGVFLVAEMSCKDALTKDNYPKNAVSLAEDATDLVIGVVCQSNLFSSPGLLQLTPGVKLTRGVDELGQQYNDPQSVMSAGADLVVVGRGITETSDELGAVIEYKKQLWAAYENRM